MILIYLTVTHFHPLPFPQPKKLREFLGFKALNGRNGNTPSPAAGMASEKSAAERR
jgi:hypothetical protein